MDALRAVVVLLAIYASIFRVGAVVNVHVVCHTHDDVGWLKTVDQYFYGSNNSIQHAGVQYILDSVIPELLANPARKFIYVEQAFFQRWWNQQDDTMKSNVRMLVQNGQLEFINGGWCMHDEAATHYVDMVDQTTLGHRYLLNEFGKTPRVGWQIDPFGHSATQAALLSAEVGFDGLFFGRIDYGDRENRLLNKTMEFLWRPSTSLGAQAQVFTGAFYNGGYGPPDGFCFDLSCADQPIQDDPNLEDYNVPDRVNNFVSQMLDQADIILGNEIMLTMGSDFQYENAHEWFKNLDKLIKYVNQDGRVNVFYSTPSQYVDAKNKANLTWTVKTDDFFPYADCPHCYWTGYFTSRPALKRYVRMSSAYLNLARQLEFLSNSLGSATKSLADAQGIAQHHDAVSGTSKQHVAYDYAKRISVASQQADAMVTKTIGSLLQLQPADSTLSLCRLTNISICSVSQTASTFGVMLYNPLLRTRVEYVTVPVPGTSYSIVDNAGNSVQAQVLKTFNNSALNNASASYFLSFLAKVPAMGYRSFFVTPGSEKNSNPFPSLAKISPERPISPKLDFTIENEYIQLKFSGTTGLLSGMTNKASSVSIAITETVMWYWSWYPTYDDQNSGAYIFRPNGTAFNVTNRAPVVTIVQGPVVQEVRQVFANWVTVTVRLFAGAKHAEFDYTVGPVPINQGINGDCSNANHPCIGREVIVRFSTSIASNKMFYTDSNGREMQSRIRDYRTWPYKITEPVASNFYPVNAAIFIKDDNAQLTILTDRTQGGASLSDGQVELMVHRRTLSDDSRGVGEPINETDAITDDGTRLGRGLIISGTHYLILDTPDASAATWRPLAQTIFAPLLPLFIPIPSGGVKSFISSHVTMSSFATSEWPVNVDLMTFEQQQDGSVLLRVSHMFGDGEDSVLSGPVSVDLNFLSGYNVSSVKELTLSANRPVTDLDNRLKWNSYEDANHEIKNRIPLKDTTVSLTTLQIRTFNITF